MLIKCPECGKEISDKALVCIGCGFPIHEYLENKEKEEKARKSEQLKKEKFRCKCCGFQNEIGIDYCKECGTRLTPYKNDTVIGRFVDDFSAKFGIYDRVENTDMNDCASSENHKSFHGVYRYGILGEKQEVYCPRCGSENCSHYQEQKIIPGKTKTTYSANLNPLKPFTLVNKKEKVVRQPITRNVSRFVCNDCGNIFG